MPFIPVFADLVRAVTTSVGTGPVAPVAAVAGHRTFAAAVSVGDQFYYSIEGGGPPVQWETGRGTLQADGAIAREALTSSADGALVDFAAGEKTIALTVAGEWYAKVEAGGGTAPSDSLITRADESNNYILQTDMSAAPGLSGDKMDLAASVHVAVNQNAGQAEFPDNAVLVWGWNMDAGGARRDPAQAGASWRLERSYLLNNVGPMVAEFHWQLDTKTGVGIRPLGSVVAHDGSLSTLGGEVDRFILTPNPTDAAAVAAGRQVLFDLKAGAAALPGMKVRFSASSGPVMEQLNAAGTAYLPLPYYNAQSALLVAPHWTLGAAISPDGGGRALATWTCTGGLTADDDAVHRVFGPARTGSYFIRGAQGAATARLIDQVYNTAGGVLSEQQLLGAGDAVHAASLLSGGGQSWSWGVHRASGSRFRIAQDYRGLSGNVALEIEPVGLIAAFGGPVRLKSFAAAALPSASAAGAGALIHVNDAPGGAAVAFSNGAGWAYLASR